MQPRFIKKHNLATRLWHWFNATIVLIMLQSGLMILNAHPHLYWGEYGANFDRPWFNVSSVFAGGRVPGWLTIPSYYSLALARRWHLTFALFLAFGFVAFMIASLINRHFRALRIHPRELHPSALLHDVREHLALRFHDKADPAAFNILQRITYVVLLFILLPLVIATGLTMSPTIDAGYPWLVDLFGGRASARSIHFIAAIGIVSFISIHLTVVILAGPINEVRSMITGWWRIPEHDE